MRSIWSNANQLFALLYIHLYRQNRKMEGHGVLSLASCYVSFPFLINRNHEGQYNAAMLSLALHAF